jgi:LPXTG-motif cell wall-anchored protein
MVAPATTTTTTPAAVASAQLPNTGVSAAVPLGIAGVLLVAGGGILVWMRMSARRRKA